MKLFAIGIVLFIGNIVFGQVVLSGWVIDEENQPISGASVLVKKEGSDPIIAYSITDGKGFYKIQISESSEEKLVIEVRNINFGSIEKTILNQTQTQNFQLWKETVELKEINIQGPPITKRGDTINYSVDSFAKEQDRSIADVLKRLPGIVVSENGMVYYQGEPINKYYIEGMDLLGGKYDLANKNLPHKDVDMVQILENHQPIKILDSIQFSNKAALNIKLKNTYTFTGQAELGSGFSPLLWHTNLTPMILNKNQQMLVSYQSNNTGNDVAKQLKTLTIEELLEQFENNSEKQEWLQIQSLNSPSNFSRKRWLDNNIHLLSSNFLFPLKKDYELRLNVSYLNDYQQRRGIATTVFHTLTDTISLFEKQYNQLYFNSLETNLSLHKNTKRNYLKNSIQFQGFWDGQRGKTETNQTPLNQNLSNRFFNFSNHLKTIFPIGKQLLTIKSYVGLNHTPQILAIRPGQFQDLLNHGVSYDKVTQEVELKSFYTHNSIGFTKGWKWFSFFPTIGFQYENQNLNTQLNTSENQYLSNEFNNELNWNRSKIYLGMRTQFKKGKWSLELATPVNLNFYKINDPSKQKNENLNRLNFEPGFSIGYEATPLWKIRLSAGINNSFGSINQLHYGYILRNYRNIQWIDTPLPESLVQTISAGISYRNPPKSLFWTLNYSNSKTKHNLLYQTQISNIGAITIEALEIDNFKNTHSISTQLGNYFRKIKTNVTLRGNYGIQNSEQILNQENSDIRNQNWGFGGKIAKDFTDWFSAEYDSNWSFSKIQIQKNSYQTISRQSHFLNLNFFPKAGHYIAVNTEIIKNNLFLEKAENLFSDVVYRFSLKKKKIDLELEWSNIFNTKNYRTMSVGSYSYVETNYLLRPRQILFKIKFSL